MSEKIVGIIGGGTAPAKVIKAGLQDLVDAYGEDGLRFLVEWRGAPPEEGPGSAYEGIYDFLLEGDEAEAFSFSIFYTDEYGRPPRVFGASRVLIEDEDAEVEAHIVASSDIVAYLWDESLSTERFVNHTDVRDLTNGLVPLPPPPAAPTVTAEEDDDDEAPRPYTREELLEMPAAVVKRYGAQMGVTAATKGGIIEALFPDGDANGVEAEDLVDAAIADTALATALQALQGRPVSRVNSIVITKIEEALLWLRSES